MNASGESRHNCRCFMVHAQRRPWKGALLWTSEVLQLWDPWETWQGTPDSEGRPSLPSWYLELLARARRSWAEEPERITVGMNRETLPAQDHLEITGWDTEGGLGVLWCTNRVLRRRLSKCNKHIVTMRPYLYSDWWGRGKLELCLPSFQVSIAIIILFGWKAV